MTDQVNNKNLQILLSKLMRDRYCSQEVNDLDACLQNYVPPNPNNSYVDQVLYRRGVRQCQPYSEAAKKCMENSDRHNHIFKAASSVPACKVERRALMRCQGMKGRDCEQEALELVYCGMAFLVQQRRERQPHTEAA